ncbi:MAG: N-acetyltransferase [Thermodesulfobacteriota bacterium]|nr:N-acetyltransferase [Thermodesulfobacteriota bacterium]
MKIQKLSIENRVKAYALLRRAFPGSEYEAMLVQKLHENDKPISEWVCLHAGKAIAYIAFSNAYHGDAVCGLHLAPMAVSPDFQKQGVGSELIRFALRQDNIKSRALFVLGVTGYYEKFGFESCSLPICPFDKNNAHFMSMRNEISSHFIVGYEAEFKTAAKRVKAPQAPKTSRTKGKKRC